jgi:hypothetical protein
MMRIPPIRFSVLLVAACAIPLASTAQQDPQAPPQLEQLEEGDAPPVTIREGEGEQRITEKRTGGKVTEIQVKSGNSTYYLKPNDQAGSAQPGDAQSHVTRPPQWQIKEFDLTLPPENPAPPAPPQLPMAPAENAATPAK